MDMQVTKGEWSMSYKNNRASTISENLEITVVHSVEGCQKIKVKNKLYWIKQQESGY